MFYQEKQSSFEEPLEKDNSISIHRRNFQSRVIKIYKVRNGLSPIVKQELLMPNNEYPYNLRHPLKTYHCTESVSVLGSKIWEILPDTFKKIWEVQKLLKGN